jgi:arginyl-tRNA synthetase
MIPFLLEIFKDAVHKAFPELPVPISLEILPSSHDKFGHYQFNSAMKLGKLLKKSPREIAEQILSHLNQNSSIFSKIEIAGVGYINITLSNEFIGGKIDFLLHDSHLGIPKSSPPKKVVIDFSSPNVAKEMHVGHLRSTIIGDSLARLFEFLGDDVLRLNHIGDWGTSFGMLIAYIKANTPDIMSKKNSLSLSNLMSWYKASKKQFDENPEFKRQSQTEVVALQRGDKDSLEIWKLICQISENAYQEIYNLLDIKIINRGESFYNPLLAKIVADLDSKGIIEISDGAKCIFIEGFKNREGENLPLIIQKSDGGYNYDTTDMAAIYHRITEEKADRIICVTDAGQATHFQMIFKAAERANYFDPKKVKVDHVPFGLVLGLDGKKFRTRSGETEKLIDLLTAAIDQAETILKERSPEMDPVERKNLAKKLGIGAVKYADLSCSRINDYVFSYDRMLKFEGNTAAFLMYSYVRIAGIKRRLNANVSDTLNKNTIHLEHPSETALGLHLIQFGDVLQQMSEELLPNRLTDYLYGLADKFNAFFRDCRVEGAKEQNERILLCEAASRVLKQGLEILGIPITDRM